MSRVLISGIYPGEDSQNAFAEPISHHYHSSAAGASQQVEPYQPTREDEALREALKALSPVRDDFRTAEYSKSFNWSEISSKFGAALDGHSHLPGRPATDDISWYAVVFRSKRREDCNNLDLFEADRLAYDEAFAHTNGALLVYWYTDLDEDNNCLATCVWTSRKHALSVNSLPKHRDAARLSSGAYVHYNIDRYRIAWDSEHRNLDVVRY